MSARALLSLLCAFFAPPVLHAQVQQEWVRTFVGPNRSDRPWAIQTDGAAGVFVTGSTSTTNNYDFVTLKYATDGAFQWSAFYNSAVGGSGDSAYALGLDESGNVYLLPHRI